MHFKWLATLNPSLLIDVINTGVDQAPAMLKNIVSQYGNDIDESRLMLHLSMLNDLCRRATPPISVVEISVVKLFSDNDPWMQLLPEVVNLLRLYLTLPVTSCTVERSFSSLKRLKTFLRSTVTQVGLNHIAVLHCHREQLIVLEEICNSFIQKNEMRHTTFAMFPN